MASTSGVRHSFEWDAHPDIGANKSTPPDLSSQPRFREGLAVVQRLGLTYDVSLFCHQIPALVDLAGAFPTLAIVANHYCNIPGVGPYAGRRDEVFAQWSSDLHKLAACPNVVLKVGGITKPICGWGFHKRPRPPTSDELQDALFPYFAHALRTFGARRCMWESNFPVDKVSCSYGVLLNAYKKMARRLGLTAEDKGQLFSGTAQRVYRLSPDGGFERMAR